MKQFQSGHVDAFGTLYERLHEPLYCFLFRYTQDEQLSIDIVHDTFEQLHKKKYVFDERRGLVKSLLFQMAYRLMLNKLNRRKKWQTILPFLVPTTKKTIASEETVVIQQAIATLPDKQRAVVLLAYYEDLPLDEVARILDIPTGTVKSRLHHALKALKQELKEAFEDERGC